MKEKIIVLLSGGLDSTTLLYYCLDQQFDPLAISIHYGQRHRAELSRAAMIAERAGVLHRIIDLSAITSLLKGSSQTDPTCQVPEGHYEDPSMRVTVVPNRNMILLSVAAAAAIGIGAKKIAYAAHAGDHAIYPDCRPEFVTALEAALGLCHYDGGVRLLAPFINRTKAEIVRLGAQLKVPFSLTYSCYTGNIDSHCGKCGTCQERILAFALAEVPDPTVYADPEFAKVLAASVV